MLIILFHNDGTGNIKKGNYNWYVKINDKLLAKGKLKGHNRQTGWEGLVKQFSKTLEKDDER